MLGVIDEIAEDIYSGAIDANLIIISAPVNETEEIIQFLAGLPLHPEVIVTDTGSTKSKIVGSAKSLKDRGITFIGGHPMAGFPKKGGFSGQKKLFLKTLFLFKTQKKLKKKKGEIFK